MYPEENLLSFVLPHLDGKRRIGLVEEMGSWAPLFPTDTFSVQSGRWSDDFSQCDVLIANVTGPKKHEYIRLLYETGLPFIFFSQTSTLGLTHCGILFHTYGINVEIVPKFIWYKNLLDGSKLKPPFNLTIFLSPHFGDNELRIL